MYWGCQKIAPPKSKPLKKLVLFSGYHIRTLAKRILPASLFRLRRNLLRRKADLARAAEKRKLVAKLGCFGPDFLFNHLKSEGISAGCVLLVQSSFDRFHNFSGTPLDVIEVLEHLVGNEGTLIMPSHTEFKDKGPFIFDEKKSPAHTGIICELFRRRPGVIRSLHPTHSVCAKGPLADLLTRDHHKEPLSCGWLSPYAKLIDHDGLILGLGLPPAYTTFLHVIEDTDLKGYPRRTYLEGDYPFSVIDKNGRRIEIKIKRRDPVLGSSLDPNRIAPFLSTKSHVTLFISGVPGFLAYSKPLFEELHQLKARGILIYK